MALEERGEDVARLRGMWPQPPGDVIGKVLHVLDAFGKYDDSTMVVTATNYVYEGVRTGLTLGDLKELIEIIGKGSL